MLNFLGFALIFVLGTAVLFVLSVFQAAAVEVNKKPRLAIVTTDETAETAQHEKDCELVKAV